MKNKIRRLCGHVAAITAISAGQLSATSLEFDSFYYYFNNADFRNYNADAYKANQSASYLNTDDRIHMIFGSLRFRHSARYKKTEFNIDMSRFGYWGTDNFQGRDAGQNPITFRHLNFNWYPTQKLAIQFGRFTYGIGEAQHDYFFYDLIDGAQAEYAFTKNYKLHLMGDIFSQAAKPDIAGFLAFVRKDPEQNDDFNGDTVTTRFGGYFQAHFVKAFSYFVRYGANTQGGADLSESGRNPLNKADGDFLSMSGIRLSHNSYSLGTADLTVSYSYGKDYQFDATRTYNALAGAMNYKRRFEGNAMRNTPKFSGGWFDPNYASMKAQSMGGMLLWSYKAYFASPHAYFYHFRDYGKRADSVTTVDRTNSKTFARIGDEILLKKFIPGLSIEPGVLVLLQTDGYQYMGTEVEIIFNYQVDNIKFALNPAVYIPSSYYTNLAATNTYIPNGTDPFFGMGFNLTYVLDLGFVAAEKQKAEGDPTDKTEDLLDQGNPSGSFTVD
jgi:hypothetical protein